ncbi:MAG: hypothetical protein MUO82_00360 [Candidatus Thermoplasmatota archaeon]|nr:hypothetical protein [Candidatus Thermoplasmatota archaeon]
MKFVNIVWLCKTLTKQTRKKYYVVVNENAVYNSVNGWICDCGHWTSGEDVYHIPIDKSKREVL